MLPFKRLIGQLFVFAISLLITIEAGALKPGDRIDTMLGEVEGDKELELAVFRNYRVVLVEFWATWSPPSVAMHESLTKQWAELNPGSAVWLSISLDRDPGAAKAYDEQHPSPSAIHVHAPGGFDGDWARSFEVVSAPSLFIIDMDGIVRDVLEQAPGDLGKVISEAQRPPKKGTPAYLARQGGDQLTLPEVAQVNQLAPDFEIENIGRNEGKLQLRDYRDKVLLIVLFASWNKQSVEYLDEINKVYEEARSLGFEMIAVSVEEDQAEVASWLRNATQRITYPVAVQRPDFPQSITSKKYPFKSELPWSFLIGKDGVVRDIGYVTKDRLRQVLVEDLNIRF